MPRSPLAYLADIVEARDTIDLALHGLDLADYRRDPIIRAAVERQFITTGEAVNALSRLAPVPAGGISHGSMIVAFRDQLTHDHPSIDDEIVWSIAAHDVPALRAECETLLDDLDTWRRDRPAPPPSTRRGEPALHARRSRRRSSVSPSRCVRDHAPA